MRGDRNRVYMAHYRWVSIALGVNATQWEHFLSTKHKPKYWEQALKKTNKLAVTTGMLLPLLREEKYPFIFVHHYYVFLN